MNENDVAWENETGELPETFWQDLPKPLYWRAMILPVKPRDKSKGGIVIPVVNQEAQAILNCIGVVIALGPQAGKHERLGGDGNNPGPDFPKVGDSVFYGRHAGAHMIHRGWKIILLNDDEILAIVPDPETLAASV